MIGGSENGLMKVRQPLDVEQAADCDRNDEGNAEGVRERLARETLCRHRTGPVITYRDLTNDRGAGSGRRAAFVLSVNTPGRLRHAGR